MCMHVHIPKQGPAACINGKYLLRLLLIATDWPLLPLAIYKFQHWALSEWCHVVTSIRIVTACVGAADQA